jgi:hypothetical protein
MLAVFVLLAGCDQANSPVEKQENKEGVEQASQQRKEEPKRRVAAAGKSNENETAVEPRPRSARRESLALLVLRCELHVVTRSNTGLSNIRPTILPSVAR